jgi:C4-dicarboxylate-specific signal transduction histidine kinase
VPAAATPRPAGTEEISTLLGAFEQMEQSIQKRDQELREAAGMLEQRVHDRTQELVATQAALVEAERFAAMGKTSAAIAHELKNALNGLGMAVDLIAQDPANQARVARLRPQVVGEIARLRDVVDSLLSFSRSPRIDRAPADLSAVVARAASGERSGGRPEREADRGGAADASGPLRRAQDPGGDGEPDQERRRGRAGGDRRRRGARRRGDDRGER